MLNEVTSEPKIKVFTDRSGMEGKIGAAAVMYRKTRAGQSLKVSPGQLQKIHIL